MILKRKKFLILLCFYAMVLLIVPFIQKAIHGELRQLPIAKSKGSVYTVGQIVEEYGYYPKDQWVADNCAFYIRTGSQGLIRMEIYYPFEIKGNETGHISVDGIALKDFRITEKTTSIQIQTTPNEAHYIVISNDFYREPDQTDVRKLSFVLNHIEAE